MPRPIRIEYENACYHVMNRGRARNNIFYKDDHYETFLKTIEESCERFCAIVHSYCLMPNHYHILLQTPNANLSRMMGHINSVYTKRFNKMQKTDGPLFRGRFKAILVESDEYFLELSKYIHKNPIQTKCKENRLVEKLSDYKWSSYQSYLDLVKAPNWLNKDLVLNKFKKDKNLLKRYQLFVEGSDNKELEEFFQRMNKEAILGRQRFKEDIVTNKISNNKMKQNRIKKEIRNKVTVDDIINNTAKAFNVEIKSITQRQTGKQSQNLPRSVAMHLIQEYKDLKLTEIAKLFDLNSVGSVSKSISVLKKKIEKGTICHELELIKKSLWFMEEA